METDHTQTGLVKDDGVGVVEPVGQGHDQRVAENELIQGVRVLDLASEEESQRLQRQIREEYGKKYPATHPEGAPAAGYEKYEAPRGYSDSYDHFKNFFSSVRTRKPAVEDAVFGFRAAGAALLSNVSMERGAIVKWDPDAMKLE